MAFKDKIAPHHFFMVGGASVVIAVFALSYFFVPNWLSAKYSVPVQPVKVSVATSTGTPAFVVTHIKTPVPLKALYMTGWVAGTVKLREPLVKLIEDTELNAVVIDIKDYTGRVAYIIEDPKLAATGWSDRRIADIKPFIAELHQKGIYVIGRIAAFQDPYMVKLHPEWAVKMNSKDEIWKDRKGISWIDVSATPMWENLVELGKDAYAQGFDELNFDYIRFPSDGNMNDISYPWSGDSPKPEALRNFFAYLQNSLKSIGAVLSADLFGMTTTNTDDLNIGQVLEKALPYFDFVAPMVYPSHYPPTFIGLDNPAAHPYEVIKYSLDRAFQRASTTPQKIRPWLQDFDLGATYTAAMVKEEIRAVYDSGFDSWMLWDAGNHYTKDALLRSEQGSTTSNKPI